MQIFISQTQPSISNLFSIYACHAAASASTSALRKKVEDIMPIATGHEREELQTELEGRDILEINYPVGPFGTKWFLVEFRRGEDWCEVSIISSQAIIIQEAPAIVKSYYDKRIVGCPGVEGEDEHDVVWFWLEKGKPHECPVCSQYFKLEVVGPGGPPDGHGDDHLDLADKFFAEIRFK